MSSSQQRVAVIGAGPMGLGAAYYLGKQGYDVSVYEAGDRVGGMTASFDFDGVEIERFFHFICATDFDYFEILEELGLRDKLKWVNTRMGYFYDGRLSNWGDPISLAGNRLVKRLVRPKGIRGVMGPLDAPQVL
jgi:protoporphyrinogen oxidase